MLSIESLRTGYWKLRSHSNRRAVRQKFAVRAHHLLAYVWRRLLFRTTFIAISGSVGKTTTKEMLAHVLGQDHKITKTPGNANHPRYGGIERTILTARPWHRFVIVEVGLSERGDMKIASALLQPDIAIMLAVKRCHTNVFKSLEAVAEEKSALLRGLRTGGVAIVNQDDEHVMKMVSGLKCELLQFGNGHDLEVELLGVNATWPQRLELNIKQQGTTRSVRTQLVGEHWTTSVLAVLAAARICGIKIDDAIAAVQTLPPFWARTQPIELPANGATVLRDDFNGSIETFESAIKVMTDARAVRKIAVFSDYSDSSKSLRKRANHVGRLAAGFADLAVFVGDYAERSQASAIREGMDPGAVFAVYSIKDAVSILKRELGEGDLVLVKGQANHHLSRIYLGLIGTVQCQLSSCGRTILCDRCPDLGLKNSADLIPYVAPVNSQL